MRLRSTRDGQMRFEPRHARNWRRLGRYCRCGVRWPCPDRYLPSTIAPYLHNTPDPRPKPADRPSNQSPQWDRGPRWNHPTEYVWVADLLTRGQRARVNGAH